MARLFNAEFFPHRIKFALAEPGDVDAVYDDLSHVGLDDADYVLHEHALAGAAPAYDGYALALFDLKVDAPQDVVRAVALMQVDDVYHSNNHAERK